jgi:hypothetical protein
LQHALCLQDLHAAGGLQYQLAARRAGTMTCWQTSAIGTTSAVHRERGAPLGEIANRSAPRAKMNSRQDAKHAKSGMLNVSEFFLALLASWREKFLSA